MWRDGMFLGGNENCDCKTGVLFLLEQQKTDCDCKTELFLFEFRVCGLSIRRVGGLVKDRETHEFFAHLFFVGGGRGNNEFCQTSLLLHFLNTTLRGR